jgi:multidrug efflux system outer membrane protein
VWSYGGSITGPIFTAGAISGQVEQAEALQKAALMTYELAVQRAFSDVEDALMSRAKLSDQLAAQERLVDASREYERLAMLLYNGGYVPYSTVLQAQQQLFPAELNLAQTRSFVFESLVAVYRAMGGGWVDQAEEIARARE